MTAKIGEREKRLHWKYAPAKPLSPLWGWLYFEVCRRVFEISPAWSGAVYAVLVVYGVANTITVFTQDLREPKWEASHD